MATQLNKTLSNIRKTEEQLPTFKFDTCQNITTSKLLDQYNDTKVKVTPVAADSYVSVTNVSASVSLSGINSFYDQEYLPNATAIPFGSKYTGDEEGDAYFVKDPTEGWVIENDGGEETSIIYTGFGFGDSPAVTPFYTVTSISGTEYPNAAITYSDSGAVTPDGTGTGTSRGMLIQVGSSVDLVVPEGKYLGASAEVNVVEID